MPEYTVRVTQTLSRDIKIQCKDKLLAETTIRIMFQNGELKLNNADEISSDIKIVESDVDNMQPGLFD